ncbi:23S ribosomal RNA methyltransferase Erm [Brachybacterium hainanense]|uniref:23S ribosomal RNA methyltransferase Erm n=1 Tax=Brachybacterium hainanense TaxID=1541174 RepID=A0ABV6RAD4_9MICO
MPRSSHGGRHELGQNFLTHRRTISRIAELVADSPGPILEIGSGDGALTRELARLDRPLVAIDVDEHRVRRLARALPGVEVRRADALHHPLDAPSIVGNIPFHLTTPILRRLLSTGTWEHAVLLTQWEVARKRAGVGGGTMMTAQAAPWFTTSLVQRVPAQHFVPRPSVDGGVLQIRRRPEPLLPASRRSPYDRFVRAVFTGRGGTLDRILARAAGAGPAQARRALQEAGVPRGGLPRDVGPEQWAALFRGLHG